MEGAGEVRRRGGDASTLAATADEVFSFMTQALHGLVEGTEGDEGEELMATEREEERTGDRSRNAISCSSGVK